MTITDNVSFWCTFVSIIVTLVSIVFSILSIHSAKKAKEYKEDTLKIKDTLDLRTLLNHFITESQNYQNKTRKLDWYKGKDENLIIEPFNKVLLSFGDYYHLLENPGEVKRKVHFLQASIQQYSRLTRDSQKEINSHIIELTELLQEETRKKTSEMIVSH